VVGQKSASGSAFYPLDPQKKSAVTVRILPVVRSADPHFTRSLFGLFLNELVDGASTMY